MTPPNPIMQLFGRSPIRPMQEHMDKVYNCSKRLLTFFDAVFTNNWELAETIQAEIVTLENEADSLKHDIREHLPHSFFLPAPRVDLLEMVLLQDRIANCARDIAGLVVGRKLNVPESIVPLYQELLTGCVATTKQANKAINELDALLEAGFKGQEASFVRGLLIELDKLEHDTDEQQVTVRKNLFVVENDHSPIDMMFLYKVIDWTGDLADRAQRLGGQLEIILAR